MSQSRGIALDANILIRAVLGRRVRSLLETREYVPNVLRTRRGDPDVGIAVPVSVVLYQDYEPIALERIAARDTKDWPIIAVALLLKIPIWTEDQDFFGSGIATWTTNRVELYLQGRHS